MIPARMVTYSKNYSTRWELYATGARGMLVRSKEVSKVGSDAKVVTMIPVPTALLKDDLSKLL